MGFPFGLEAFYRPGGQGPGARMTTNSVAENLKTWDQAHAWPEDGDEWKGQAVVCGVPYEDWKQSLVERLIDPYLPPGASVMEIAPGHGRWTGYLAERA